MAENLQLEVMMKRKNEFVFKVLSLCLLPTLIATGGFVLTKPATVKRLLSSIFSFVSFYLSNSVFNQMSNNDDSIYGNFRRKQTKNFRKKQSMNMLLNLSDLLSIDDNQRVSYFCVRCGDDYTQTKQIQKYRTTFSILQPKRQHKPQHAHHDY